MRKIVEIVESNFGHVSLIIIYGQGTNSEFFVVNVKGTISRINGVVNRSQVWHMFWYYFVLRRRLSKRFRIDLVGQKIKIDVYRRVFIFYLSTYVFERQPAGSNSNSGCMISATEI